MAPHDLEGCFSKIVFCANKFIIHRNDKYIIQRKDSKEKRSFVRAKLLFIWLYSLLQPFA